MPTEGDGTGENGGGNGTDDTGERTDDGSGNALDIPGEPRNSVRYSISQAKWAANA